MYPENVKPGKDSADNGLRKDLPASKRHPLVNDMVAEAVFKTAPRRQAEPITIIKDNTPAKKEWICTVSDHAKNTVNPIRKIVDQLQVAPNPNKKPIKLHLGDPTLTGTLPPCETAVEAIREAVESHAYDGYGPAVGTLEAREAIAQQYSLPEAPINADDVILASGCSHALQLAIEALANAGDNILCPQPGFPLYSTLCRPHGIEDRFYRLDMNRGAEVDLTHMESLIDERTKAIIMNNPGNPTGAVFSKTHLEDILTIAYKHKIPIIADEIYGDLTYDGARFHPIASLSPKVPVISCDGIGKRYLVPGWRLGWVVCYDRYGALAEVKKGMVALSQKIVGPCALVQGALPKILRETPQSFFDNIKAVLARNAQIVYDALSKIPGIKPIRPQGAMYMMVGFDTQNYGDETPFVQGLISEESVYCLPGGAFGAPGWFRLVLTYSDEVTLDACNRLTEYCARHYKKNTTVPYHDDSDNSEGDSSLSTESD
uniref:Tyrosine aminotransferase n=1 Tax=Steinernema glaseri TaxID=37863 RepID=A0A1I7Y641_9BILA